MPFRSKHAPAAALGAAIALHAALGAEPPEVLDRAPADAALIVAAPTLGGLDRAVAQLITLLELRTASTLSQIAGIIGVRDALDFERGGLLAVEPPGPDGEPGAWGVVLPMVPGADPFTALGAAPEGEGVWRFTIGDFVGRLAPAGEAHLVVAPTADAALRFAAVRDQTAGHAARLGDAGLACLDGAPIFVVVAPALARNALERFGAEALVGPEVRVAVAGVRPTGFGLTIDGALSLAPGSALARACAAPHDGVHAELLRSMRGDGYMIAGGVDAAHPFFRLMLERLGEARPVLAPIAAAREDLDALTVAAYAPPDWPSDKRLSMRLAMRWRADDAAAVARAFDETAAGVLRAAGGTWLYDDGAATVGGRPAAIWGVRAPGPLPPFAWLDAFAAAPLPAAGRETTLTGYAAASGAEGRAVTGRDKAFAASVLFDAEGEALGDDPILRQMSMVLPPPRDAELYLNAKPVLDAASGWLEAAGVEAQTSAWLPPIGAALNVSEGGVGATVFIPTGVLRPPASIGLERLMSSLQDRE